MDPLYTLAAHYRAAQLCAHTYHHLAKGPTFFQDHEEFGEVYGAYETAFDDLCEEALALKQPYDASAMLSLAVKLTEPGMKDYTNLACYNRLLKFELEFQRQIKEMMKDKNLADGTQNLIQGLATESNKRKYKFQQRTS